MKRIAAFLACGLLVLTIIGHADAVDFPDFSLPIYPGATNQKTHLDKPAKGVKAATYRIATVFPARDLIEFYNKEMKKRGFKKYHDPLDSLTQFEWNTFNSRTGNWEPTRLPPARYTAKWSNEKEDQFVWVLIDFKPNQKELQSGTASVSIHVARYSEYLKELDAIKKSEHNKADVPDQKSVR
ncbi:MAG: hypothetical protein CXR31_14055 [Geobacter sp.]|nr:MAG: hypothetical protein CXR31_14055 [Geobacter sp.]